MFNLAIAALLRGFRTSDSQRIAVGALLLFGALYRRGRRKGALIGSYDLEEGDQMTVRVPKRWRDDPSVLAAAKAGLKSDDDGLQRSPTSNV